MSRSVSHHGTVLYISGVEFSASHVLPFAVNRAVRGTQHLTYATFNATNFRAEVTSAEKKAASGAEPAERTKRGAKAHATQSVRIKFKIIINIMEH